jgi:murein DD-endopeptidase MepM/ murein hydrolase activator NlpD
LRHGRAQDRRVWQTVDDDHGHVHGVHLRTSNIHLSAFVVHVGEHAEHRQLIAYPGSTGRATACHLHFMVYVDGDTVDPMPDDPMTR